MNRYICIRRTVPAPSETSILIITFMTMQNMMLYFLKGITALGFKLQNLRETQHKFSQQSDLYYFIT